MNEDRPPLDVLVAGPAYCDLVFADLDDLPAPGTERFADSFLVTAGGSAITAVALARLGRRVGLVADLGDDAFGEVVREVLDAEGVDTRWLRTAAGVSTPVTAVLSTPRDRSFVTHLPQVTAPPEIAAALAGSGARHLHIAGFPVARALPSAVDIAHAAGATASFDPGWDEAALADASVRNMAKEADVLLPNRLEAVRLVDGQAHTTAADALAMLSVMRDRGITVVKDGSHGAVAYAEGKTLWTDSPVVHAIDPTGAGDVFDAGFLDAWMDGAELEMSLRMGAACGAHAVTLLGGPIAAPTPGQRDALLATLSESLPNPGGAQ